MFPCYFGGIEMKINIFIERDIFLDAFLKEKSENYGVTWNNLGYCMCNSTLSTSNFILLLL